MWQRIERWWLPTTVRVLHMICVFAHLIVPYSKNQIWNHSTSLDVGEILNVSAIVQKASRFHRIHQPPKKTWLLFQWNFYGQGGNNNFSNREPAPFSSILTVFVWWLFVYRTKNITDEEFHRDFRCDTLTAYSSGFKPENHQQSHLVALAIHILG